MVGKVRLGKLRKIWLGKVRLGRLGKVWLGKVRKHTTACYLRNTRNTRA